MKRTEQLFPFLFTCLSAASLTVSLFLWQKHKAYEQRQEEALIAFLSERFSEQHRHHRALKALIGTTKVDQVIAKFRGQPKLS